MDARFKALSNETRREILLLLAEGPMEAGKLQERFPITFASISYHLSVLKHSGLVTDKKEEPGGKRVSKQVEGIHNMMSRLLPLSRETPERGGSALQDCRV